MSLIRDRIPRGPLLTGAVLTVALLGCSSDRPEAPKPPVGTPARTPPTSTEAPPTAPGGVLTGRIVDTLGVPVGGATVHCIGQGTTALETATDPIGRFVFRPTAGTLRLFASHPHFALQEIGPPIRFAAAGIDLGSWALTEGNGLLVELRDANGTPLPGARVAAAPLLVEAALPPPFAAWARREESSGSDGVAVLYGLRPGIWRIVVSAPGHASVGVVHAQPATARRSPRIRLQLFRGHPLQGQLLDLSGNPIPDATIRCRPGPDLPTQTTRTSANGDFSLRDLPAGPHRIQLEHRDFGHRFRTAEIRDGRGRVRWNLSPGLALGGQVLDRASRRPVAGARVFLRTSDGPERTVTTGADGMFRFRGIAPGIVSLRTASQAWLPAASPPRRLTASPPEPVILLLQAAHRLRGEVHAAGAPLAGVAVRLIPSDGLAPAATGRTDASGSFTIDQVPAGRYRPQFEHPAWPTTWGPEIRIEAQGGRNEADQVLPRTVLRPGTVLTGSIPLRDGWSPTVARIYLVPEGIPRATLTVHADTNGRFRFPPVAAGSYRMFYDYPDKQLPTQAAATRAATRVTVTVKPTESPAEHAQDLRLRVR